MPEPSDQMRDLLAISEQRYRRLFEASRDGILILDSEFGRVTDANPFMAELLGYSREELLGKELWEIGIFKDREANRKAAQELKTHGFIRYEGLPVETRRSRKREVEFISNVYDVGGRNVIQCSIRNTTTQHTPLGDQPAAARDQTRLIADSLQRAILYRPAEDAFPGMSVHTAFSTASEEALVGGDFWDTFAFDDGHIALVCGDVMGHGLVSAVFTTELRHVMRAYVREHEKPSRILRQMNEYVAQSNRLFQEGINSEGSDMPVCMSVAVIDRRTGDGSLAVAAMEWPLVVRASGQTEPIKASGLPLGLGIGPRAVYHGADFRLAEGDTLIMNTDGITEARSGREFLGGEGLARLAAEHCRESLSDMGESILSAAADFAGGTLRDDACLVLARKR